jgi:hypothetical protein
MHESFNKLILSKRKGHHVTFINVSPSNYHQSTCPLTRPLLECEIFFVLFPKLPMLRVMKFQYDPCKIVTFQKSSVFYQGIVQIKYEKSK